MNPDVSVVIPLYNARDYLKYAVDSVLDQTLKGVEVIVVDDCSTDGSLELCRELYGSNDRVRILQQPKNGGPGAARNTGIRSASGEYVAFVDSDDGLLPDTLRNLFEAAKKFGADVVHNTKFCFTLPNEESNMSLKLIDDSVELLINEIDRNPYTEVTLLSDDFDSRLEDWITQRVNRSVWLDLFRREFILSNDIIFSDMKLGEDMVFSFECLFKANKYVIVPGGGYIYRIVGTSLSRNKKSSAHVIKALTSQILGGRKMSSILSSIPFFAANPDKAIKALEYVLNDVEMGFIRPAFQVLGEEGLRSDGAIHEFMCENFGEYAPYVEFLFYELHKNYEPVIDWVGISSNPDEVRRINKK